MSFPIPFTYLQPQTAASTSDQQVRCSTNQYSSITVSADALAGGEIVGLFVMAGTTAKQVTDIYGTAVNLTATVSAVALEGGPDYIFVKDVTADPCGIYINPNERR